MQYLLHITAHIINYDFRNLRLRQKILYRLCRLKPKVLTHPLVYHHHTRHLPVQRVSRNMRRRYINHPQQFNIDVRLILPNIDDCSHTQLPITYRIN